MEIKATHEEKLEALKSWESRRKEMDSNIAKFENLVGISFESPFVESIRRLQEQDRKITSQIVGDTEEWLDWYCYENGFGADGMTVEINDQSRLVPNIEALLAVIEENA